jgi:excinuclease ABC subunit C
LKYIADLDYILVPTEQDAFILEANLIKRNKPKYNVLLKDDKRYPFVKITLNEPFPELLSLVIMLEMAHAILVLSPILNPYV